MRVTIGSVTFDDGRPSPTETPAFPDGVAVHIFDDWSQAAVAQPDAARGIGGWSRDRRTMVATVRADPETFLGLNPSAIIDHASEPWPWDLRRMLHWRAERARIRITRAAD